MKNWPFYLKSIYRSICIAFAKVRQFYEKDNYFVDLCGEEEL